MAESDSSPWARAVRDGIAATVVQAGKQEFTWKPMKKGRLRPHAGTPKEDCYEDHCSLSGTCSKEDCIARLAQQLDTLKAENIALDAACDGLRRQINDLVNEIFEECNIANFASETESSKTALYRASSNRSLTLKRLSCGCTSCQLEIQQGDSKSLDECLSAARYRFQTLREYRIANDREAVQRTQLCNDKPSKYFTPVGKAKAKGVSALRPALEMQNSYDVAALTTNSMKARALKVAREDQPKSTHAGDEGEGGWTVARGRKRH